MQPYVSEKHIGKPKPTSRHVRAHRKKKRDEVKAMRRRLKKSARREGKSETENQQSQ